MKYYVALLTKSHAFLLEQRLTCENIKCELTYMPREIMKDLCNMGIKFDEKEVCKAINTLKHSGLPGWKVYKEIVCPSVYKYELAFSSDY